MVIAYWQCKGEVCSDVGKNQVLTEIVDGKNTDHEQKFAEVALSKVKKIDKNSEL